MKDFNSVFIQNKEIQGIKSAKYHYGAFMWSLQADVNKYLNQENGDLWFIIRLFCESDNKSNFPLLARMNFMILNKDKDLRKDYLQGNFIKLFH